MANFCSECGKAISKGDLFCTGCGTKLSAPSSPAAAKTPAKAPKASAPAAPAAPTEPASFFEAAPVEPQVHIEPQGKITKKVWIGIAAGVAVAIVAGFAYSTGQSTATTSGSDSSQEYVPSTSFLDGMSASEILTEFQAAGICENPESHSDFDGYNYLQADFEDDKLRTCFGVSDEAYIWIWANQTDSELSDAIDEATGSSTNSMVHGTTWYAEVDSPYSTDSLSQISDYFDFVDDIINF